MDDYILESIFLDEGLREEALQRASDKHIPIWMLKKMCSNEWWIEKMEGIANGTYEPSSPYTAKIPKDDGDYRVVKINPMIDRKTKELIGDRVIFIIIYLWIVRNTKDMVHPSCYSYQAGQSCHKIVGKIVREVHDALEAGLPVIKVDFTKYFDRMPRWIIHWAFDMVEMKFGKSTVVEFLRKYYNNDWYYDTDSRQWVKEYAGLKQGCTIAAWLANVCMWHLDERLSHLDCKVYRYCDDVLLVGNDAERGLEIIRETMVALSSVENGKEYDMELKDRKTQYINPERWFTFLGYNIKGTMYSYSAKWIKHYEDNMRHILDTATPENVVHKVNRFLHGGEYPQFEWIARIKSEQDIRTLDMYTRDIIRAVKLGRKKVGHLGCQTNGKQGCIQYHTHGTQTMSNYQRMPRIDGYLSLWCLTKNRRCGKAVYMAQARELLM